MLHQIDPKMIQDNVFSLIGDQWMLITAGSAERCNTMTASWGGLGVLWGRPAATAYIRPQRYTYEFVEREPSFTLSFFEESFRPQLNLCGSKSGRDIDKVKACGLTVQTGAGGAPFFAEARLVLVCQKLYWQDLDPAHFLDSGIGAHYPNHDYHRMYIGAVTEAYQSDK